nr:MAG TPA: hypothetical protein [Caudoviricetes sp.]
MVLYTPKIDRCMTADVICLLFAVRHKIISFNKYLL